MNIAELFVQVRVAGAEKAGSAIFLINKQLKETGASAWAAKAAIVAMVYGLERLTAASGERGNNLAQFGMLTGLDPVALQKWQYAAMQVGVANAEVEQSFVGLQKAMMDLSTGNGGPVREMGLLQQAIGRIIPQDKINDIEYMMKALQEASQKMGPAFGNQMLGAFGISGAVGGAMRRNAFTDKMLGAAPHLSNGQTAALQNVHVGLSNFWNKMGLGMSGMVARHGPLAIKELNKTITPLLKIAEAISKLVEKSHIFELLATALDKIADKLEGGATMLDALDENSAYVKSGKGYKNSPLNSILRGEFSEAVQRVRDVQKKINQPVKVNGGGGKVINQKNHIEINTNTDKPQEHASVVSKEVNSAFYQMASNVQVS